MEVPWQESAGYPISFLGEERGLLGPKPAHSSDPLIVRGPSRDYIALDAVRPRAKISGVPSATSI
jgi:hypothetical protein